MTWTFACANFDQMHMNTNVGWVAAHPDAELVGICDEDPSTSTGSLPKTVSEFDIPTRDVYDDLDTCLTDTDPDVVIGCPRNSEHAAFVERVAPYDVHLAIEKPLAATLSGADRILDAVGESDRLFVLNWPVMWDPVIHEVRTLVADGTIGDVIEVQCYDGNSGAPPEGSWFYDPEAGGGSLLDYLGYGTTFSTWFRGGDLPTEVTAETHVPDHLDVDVQSSTICRFDEGLSAFQTSWRMLTDPWEIQPQPPKGYEIVGTEGTISTRERSAPVRVTTEAEPDGYPVEPSPLPERFENLVAYMIDLLETDSQPAGPAAAEFCRGAHRIVETARRSAERGETLPLVE